MSVSFQIFYSSPFINGPMIQRCVVKQWQRHKSATNYLLALEDPIKIISRNSQVLSACVSKELIQHCDM
jgi:hypothetical protein